MDDFFRIEFDFFLDDTNEYRAVLSNYRRVTEEPVDVDIFHPERQFTGMVVNLSGHVLPYWVGDERGSLGKGQYNFFSIPASSSRWLLKPKMNSILCLECSHSFLQQFVKDVPALIEYLAHASLGEYATLTKTNVPLPPSILDGIVDLMKQRQFVGKARHNYLRAKAGNILLTGLINSQRRHDESREAVEASELHGIYQYMVDNLEHLRDTRSLMSLSKLPEAELKAKFKRLYGKTLVEALHEERLKKGEYLLTYTYMPILEIGVRIGYTSRNSFSTAFYQHYGMYPKDFRNRFNKLT